MNEELELVTQAYELIVDFMVTYSFQLIGAVLILALGFLVGGWVSRVLLRIQESRNVDVTLRQFIASIARLLVIGMFVIIALSKLGISITPLIAAIGGLALGASFAIQGPVSNYGAGLVIILTRMFKVGDTINVQGCSGVVDEITLATTRLVAEDGEDIVIPNRQIAGEIHTNSKANRIVEGVVGISYGDDPARAVEIIRTLLSTNDAVAGEPAPTIGISAFADSAIEIGYRYYVPSLRFFKVQYAVNLAIHQAFKEQGISIPFPQRDVHLVNAGAVS